MTYEERQYLEAKRDVLKAAESVKKLTLQQREALAKEVFGMECVETMCKMMRQLGF